MRRKRKDYKKIFREIDLWIKEHRNYLKGVDKEIARKKEILEV